MIKMEYFPYKEPRIIQGKTIEAINRNIKDYRYFILELGTGIGKSAIAKTICSSYNKAFLLTVTKQLQDQYIKDFKGDDIQSIKGKVNYTCTYNDSLNCEVGPCVTNNELLQECKKQGLCEYYRARDYALASNTALTSYQYFLRAMECSGFWKQRDVIVMDECHMLEQQITQWASMELIPTDLHIKFDLFDNIDSEAFRFLVDVRTESGYENNKQWLINIFNIIKLKRLKLYKEIEDRFDGKSIDELNPEQLDEILTTHKDYYDLDKIYKKLDIFFQDKSKHEWIIEPSNGGLLLQPIRVGGLFKQFVNPWASKKVFFMSATILDIDGFCKEIGIKREEVYVIKVDSPFDTKRSPIVYYPTGSMKYSNIDATMPNIVNNVKYILDNHKNDKGIIHTGSYAVAKQIYELVGDKRLIIKDDNESNEDLLKRHIKSKSPTVLLSPSLTTGADLKDDLSRFQIIVKLPWLSLADKRVEKKMKVEGNWYVQNMFINFIQACGRSTRSEKDWSVTYVLDSSFYFWTLKYSKWFTKRYLRRIVWKKDNFDLRAYNKYIS